MTLNRDYIGAIFSWLCIIHCMAGPLLLVLGISSLGIAFLEDERVHHVLIIPIIFFALWSVPKGIKIHNHPLPGIAAALGVIFLLLGLVVESQETPLTVGASCLLIFAHLFNNRLLVNIGSKK